MATVNEKLTAIAEPIREVLGTAQPLTLDDMAESIPKVYSKGRSDGNADGQAIGYDKGYDAGYAAGKEEGGGGVDLSNDTVTEEKVFEGITFHNADGESKTGTFTIASEMSEQDSLISRIKTALQGKAAGGGGDSDLPTGYRRVSYIRFDDAQIVDTGIVPTKTTKIRVLFTREVSTAMYLYGVASSDNTASVTAYLSTGGSWRFGNKSTAYTATINPDLVQSAVIDQTGIVRPNGNVTFTEVTDFEAVGSLLIGGGRNADGTVGTASYIGNIYLFQMWSGDTEVLHLIPVADSSGTYRFYDTINGAFHDSITDTPLGGGNL